ncbi:RcnB family protein [Pantoea vagans]|uniref:RcnB family protein n=1 Tax=Pantoea vagans TaxID=470934 RepID=UPI0032090714
MKINKMQIVLIFTSIGACFNIPIVAAVNSIPDQGISRDEHDNEGPEMPHHFSYHGQDFERGKPVPEDFRVVDHSIENWNDKGLPPPPDGQRWAYIDGNYVLIAVKTGIVTSIILNSANPH